MNDICMQVYCVLTPTAHCVWHQTDQVCRYGWNKVDGTILGPESRGARGQRPSRTPNPGQAALYDGAGLQARHRTSTWAHLATRGLSSVTGKLDLI